jgi:hypothetical protein
MFSMVHTLSILCAISVLGAAAWFTRDELKHRNRSSLLFVCGLIVLFVSERWFSEGEGRWIIAGVAGFILVLSHMLRHMACQRADGHTKEVHQSGRQWMWVASLALVFYLFAQDTVAVDLLGLEDDAAQRWRGVWTALWPIVGLCGTLPAIMLDRVLLRHPIEVPAGAPQHAVHSGLKIALAFSLLFPLNYLANTHNVEWDTAYFRTTEPGETTLQLTSTLVDPIEVTLFYPAGSDVAEDLKPYFQRLVQHSKDTIKLRVVDQALAPEQAAELKIRNNGYVVFSQGEAVEKFKLDTNHKKARRELKKLDETVLKNLLKLTRDKRTAYFLAGHGEASSTEKDNPFRKLSAFKRALESQNYLAKTLGFAQGSGVGIPDDAAVLVIAAPEKPLLPEELEGITTYLDNGGRLYLLLDPSSDPLTPILSYLNIEAGSAPLANAEVYMAVTRRGKADRINLATNRYGSHPSVKQLSRNSAQLNLVLPSVVGLRKTDGPKNKVSTLIRSFPNTWEDTNGDFERGEDETSKVFDIAFAVEGVGEENTHRAIVVGDVNFLSDVVLQFSKGNAVFAFDSLMWLVGDEELVGGGGGKTEEDVKIVHTRSENMAWFLSTVFAFPLLIFAVGVVRIRRSGRKQ